MSTHNIYFHDICPIAIQNHILTRGPRGTICSPDKNSYCTSVNAMELLPVLPQQSGHKFDHTIKRSKIIWTNSVDFESPMLYTKNQPLSFVSSGEEDFKVFYHIWVWQPSCSIALNHWTNCQHLFERRSHRKSGEKQFKRFPRRRHLKFHDFIHVQPLSIERGHVKFEENSRCQKRIYSKVFTDDRLMDGWMASDHNSSSWAFRTGELKISMHLQSLVKMHWYLLKLPSEIEWKYGWTCDRQMEGNADFQHETQND